MGIEKAIACSEIYFEPGNIPQSTSEHGINLFSSSSISRTHFEQAMWPGFITKNERETVINYLLREIRIESLPARLSNLLALSFIHRFLNILTTSARLYLDKFELEALQKVKKYLISKRMLPASIINPLFSPISNYFYVAKWLASSALSAAPMLFLIFVVGCPTQALIVNACITQVAATAISHISLSLGNYLRSLDLISHDNQFNNRDYTIRLGASFVFDIALTSLWYAPTIHNSLWNVSDNYNILRYCITRNIPSFTLHSIIASTEKSIPLIDLREKLFWTVGRVAFDCMILAANKIGWIQDIRSPFINAFGAKNNARKAAILAHLEQCRQDEERRQTDLAKEKQLKQLRKARAKEDLSTEDRGNKNCSSTNSTSSSAELLATTESMPLKEGKSEPVTKKKVKRKDNTPALVGETSNRREEQSPRTNPTLPIQGLTYYDLPSSSPAKYFGVLHPQKLKVAQLPSKFTTCLEIGRIGANTDIRIIGRKSELRPSGDDRVVGRVYNGIDGPATMYPLAQAMEVYDDLKEASGGKIPKEIIYEKYVSTHDKLRKELRSR